MFGIATSVRGEINDRLSAGIELGAQIISEDGDNVSTVSVSPFIRYNCANVGAGKIFFGFAFKIN